MQAQAHGFSGLSWNGLPSWHGSKVACEQATGANTTQDHHEQLAILNITSAPIRSSLIQQLLEQQLADLRDCREGAVALCGQQLTLVEDL
ncbi:hypothetical protein [Cyanobium sp. A2C-AMD]|uniref:hypothetical protein n=1 Tax=Cyanobium sp. A2C-AMD TaxID=2823695 RepID=UPI0020CC3B76|nr:hypothetical protein [Cyanobium sp. A2C-AMD]MCP9877319.1 hypothetical protein [Cyanobium sp. A2C-AMD]